MSVPQPLSRRFRLLVLLCALSATSPLLAQDAALAGEPPIEIEAGSIGLIGHVLPVEIRAGATLASGSIPVEIRDPTDGTLLAQGQLQAGESFKTEIRLPEHDGPFEVALPGHYLESATFSVRSIPGWWTLLPPIIAILLALIFRQVVPALLAGVWFGAGVVHDGIFVGLLRAVDKYVVGALADGGNATMVLFTLLLGGMVGVISRSGGTHGLVDLLTPYATNSRRGQVVTWLLGMVVFFDDYANTLLVGNTMRPVTDRLKISREKLAYIVDSTAAPVASLALVSTWIGYEVSLIGNSLKELGSDQDAYAVFLQSLPYNFYPILTLVFGLLVASTLRDFGPMRRAEQRASTGQVLAANAVPLADFDGDALAPPKDKPQRWINAAIPVLTVLVVTFLTLWIVGRSSLAAGGDPAGTISPFRLGIQGIGSVFSAGDAFQALLYGSFAGSATALILAVGQRILSLADGLAAWINGMKSMMVAMVILILAWSIGQVCADLNTAGYMVALLTDALDPRMLPAIVFILAAGTAFSTGTSWATMAILIPLAVPTAMGLGEAANLSAGVTQGILLGSISAVLAGALFGDHCSPISDTTVLSSMSSGCDHVDHVRTQLPYALLVATVAIVFGYIPAGMGFSPFLCLLVGAGTLALLLRLIGRRPS